MIGLYTPQQIAEYTGISIYTLHYYERIGLLDHVERQENGHRRYSESDLERLHFLKRLKATGMPIRAMVRYVELYRQGPTTLQERRRILTNHRNNVLKQITLMNETLAMLDEKVAKYDQLAAEQFMNELQPTS